MEPIQFPGNKKLVVGWFSFTCCEDSTIVLTELLNDHLDEWKKVIEFKHMKVLKSKNDMSNLDVAFIEGAASSEKQEEEMKKIRENAKYVVAIGACASTGMPSASRNNIADIELNEKIQYYLKTFNYGQKVKKLDEVIKVDDYVQGCPMNVATFSTTVEKYLKLFKIIQP
jgi:coenzyme F420-reducing hydrogenase gamma subunit